MISHQNTREFSIERCINQVLWEGNFSVSDPGIHVLRKKRNFLLETKFRCSITELRGWNVYLCLVTGRIFFHLSPPTSNLNNVILIFILNSLFKTQPVEVVLVESNDIIFVLILLSRPVLALGFAQETVSWVFTCTYMYVASFHHNSMAGSG